MIKIHAIQTGLVQIKQNQVRQVNNAYPKLINVLFGREWSEWLPIYAWLIEHPEGLFIVDTGETAKTGQRGYLSAHPYYKMGVRFAVKPEEEIGPQLKQLEFDPSAIKTVILTHLHTDHAGGLHHFPDSQIWVEPTEFKSASGLTGLMSGYLPHHWPEEFKPRLMRFEDGPFGPFEQSQNVTLDGRIVVIPTPGHVSTHVSVIVRGEDVNYFLAGDASYNQALMIQGHPDGISTSQGKLTLTKIQQFVRDNPTVYLPSHEAEAERRLREKEIVC